MDAKTEAYESAERVLADFWDGFMPVEPYRIARAMGIEVVKRAGLDPDLAGVIEKREGRCARIYLNRADAENRRRFTCADEVGHFVRNAETEFEYVDHRDQLASEGTDPEERFANAFAAALLMPEAAVRALRELGVDEKQMASELGVSEEAMRHRLGSLRR